MLFLFCQRIQMQINRFFQFKFFGGKSVSSERYQATFDSPGIEMLRISSSRSDRVIYMKTFLPKGTPKYCSPSWAKKVIPTVICICAFINLPYFFIFKEIDGRFTTTDFFESISIILIGSNGMMISIMRKLYRSSYSIRNGNSSCEKKQLFSQTQLTLTIIVVVFLFLIGEIPMYLASRRSAITMLFQRWKHFELLLPFCTPYISV
ncbi:hypothetical protein Bhyg_02441 [Pseudolycoriella hygida]|uniref:Uncharacterized protein n=1 Tax=Pseudolycoriella hygida TaxID=35572 RepID=A0A9Q0NBK0_9DIPT|nr:hypothetical protein Bhyg_02441 [Pseudolycoriella hygida]